jgi:hypothetical protein
MTGLLLSVAVMGVPWWWSYLPDEWKSLDIPDTVQVSVRNTSIAGCLGTVILLIVAFTYARWRGQRSITVKALLHSMSHEMRDSICSMLQRTGARKSKHDLHHEAQHLISASNTIAERIVKYYGTLTRTDCVSAVIRLAADDPCDDNDMTHFVTVGRAGALDPKRKGGTQAIPENVGLPKLLGSEKINASGVVFIEDVKKATEHHLYVETQNEIDFPDDYNCIIAVPLNGWNGQKKTLIGILTIAGRNKSKLLCVHHIDLLKAIGDRLAEYYSFVVARLSASNRMPAIMNINNTEAA